MCGIFSLLNNEIYDADLVNKSFQKGQCRTFNISFIMDERQKLRPMATQPIVDVMET